MENAGLTSRTARNRYFVHRRIDIRKQAQVDIPGYKGVLGLPNIFPFFHFSFRKDAFHENAVAAEPVEIKPEGVDQRSSSIHSTERSQREAQFPRNSKHSMHPSM